MQYFYVPFYLQQLTVPGPMRYWGVASHLLSVSERNGVPVDTSPAETIKQISSSKKKKKKYLTHITIQPLKLNRNQ